MNCIYCNESMFGSQRTNEHIIPQWIIKKLKIQNYKHNFIPISKELIQFDPRMPVTQTLTHKVCSECNNGWLSTIDNSCVDILNALIDGDKLEYEKAHNLKSIEKLYIFIYKIFLNFFATGPKSFKENKLFIFNDFYKNKCPPNNVELYISKCRTSDPIFINHVDIWITDPENYVYKDPFGLRFKFFLQLGDVAFVLCSAGDNAKFIMYDPNYLHPLVNKTFLISKNLGLDHAPPKQFKDNFVNRLLINSIQTIG